MEQFREFISRWTGGGVVRNDVIGFRVVDTKGRVMSNWGKLRMVDLIPGDDCWGRLVFTTAKGAEVTSSGVPERVQIAVNTVFPSELYDIHLFEGSKTVRKGRVIKVDRVTIDVEGSNGTWVVQEP